MNDENIIDVAPVESSAQPNHNDSPCARTGKIARLPGKIREQINQRLFDGQGDPQILPWLNELPAVKEILSARFDGQPINKQNLSQWRQGGYQDWLKEQKTAARLQRVCRSASKISGAARGKIAAAASDLISCEIFELFDNAATGGHPPADLAKMAFAVSALRHADQNQVRLKHEKTRVYQGNEQLTLAWDKHLRDCVAIAQHVLNDALAKMIQEADIDNGEKIELLGHTMFGKKWQGREVPVPKPPPPPQSTPPPPENSKPAP